MWICTSQWDNIQWWTSGLQCIEREQARKPRSYASLKLCCVTDWLTGGWGVGLLAQLEITMIAVGPILIWNWGVMTEYIGSIWADANVCTQTTPSFSSSFSSADSSLATTAIFALAMLAKLTLTIIGMVYDQKYIIRHSGLSDACAPWLLEYVYFCQSQVSRASSRPGWFSAGIFVKGQTHFLILSICSSPLSHLHLSCSPRRWATILSLVLFFAQISSTNHAYLKLKRSHQTSTDCAK